MNKEQLEKLKQLIINEMAFRKEFRAKRQELGSLVYPIAKHVKECCKWWEQNLPNSSEIIVIMDDGTSFKITKPKDEDGTYVLLKVICLMVLITKSAKLLMSVNSIKHNVPAACRSVAILKTNLSNLK